MLKAYKYRIMPSVEQMEKMEHHFGSCRLIWNLALDVKTMAYASNRTHISRYDLQKQLIELKKEYKWLYDVDSQSLQSALLHLDKAYLSFFNGGGYPKFKKKFGRQSYSCPQRVSLVQNKLILPKVGAVDVIVSRSFLGKIKTVTITKETTGKYFASILVDNGLPAPNKMQIDSKSMVGLDLGLKDFATMSDGKKSSNPKYLKASMQRLKCLQRRMSRKIKGSKRRTKAKLKIALQHEKITNQRMDFLHKLSSAIIKRYDSICVENLAVSNMVRNRRLSQAISDVGWGEFLRQLEYKCDWRGKNFLEVPRFFASSKTCSDCGAINETLVLSEREWHCASCGSFHDRDINAAKNIKQYFIKKSGEGISDESVELLPKGKAKKRKTKNSNVK